MEIVELPPEPDPAESLVYVAVGKAKSSMDAVRWALHNEVGPSGEVILVHVFPEIREIPTELGNLPRSGVNPQQLESHMIYVRSKWSELLKKFIKECNSCKVKVDTVLIEGDRIAQAIVELIPVMGIRKLIIGASKSSTRKLKKGEAGKEGQIVEGAPETCEVKIICNGNQISATTPESPSPRPSVFPETKPTPSPTTPRIGENKKNHRSGDDETTNGKCLCL